MVVYQRRPLIVIIPICIILLQATTTTTTTASSSSSSLLAFRKKQPLSSSSSSTRHHRHCCCYTPPPPKSPATGLENKIYQWRDQPIRYQVTGNNDDETTTTKNTKSIILIHGLFVNADHWRKTLTTFNTEGKYRIYSIDLLGYGYTPRHHPTKDVHITSMLNGENDRFDDDDDDDISKKQNMKRRRDIKRYATSILPNMKLGTADGKNGINRIADIDLRHPQKGSPYNFFTWAELITDFTHDVVNKNNNNSKKKTTLVCNSIGTMSALQAVLDQPQLYDGTFIISPNFRELHSAEVPFPSFVMPLVRSVQSYIRNDGGKVLFDILAKPWIVKGILRVPYARMDAVDDNLVKVLLDPLLMKGSSDVLFDTLSYSAGPLPEQLLSEPSFPTTKTGNKQNKCCKVWICYGKDDPWTPGGRVERLIDLDSVERVVPLEGVGHCPHDEAPELVHPLLQEFLDQIEDGV